MTDHRIPPALMRGECPDLREVGQLLRGWLDGEGLSSLPMGELQASWKQHCDRVEGEDGLFAIVAERAPRMARDLEGLRADHEVLARKISALVGHEGSFDDVREAVRDLADDIDGHCARSVEIVFNAFDQELGGG